MAHRSLIGISRSAVASGLVVGSCGSAPATKARSVTVSPLLTRHLAAVTTPEKQKGIASPGTSDIIRSSVDAGGAPVSASHICCTCAASASSPRPASPELPIASKPLGASVKHGSHRRWQRASGGPTTALISIGGPAALSAARHVTLCACGAGP